MFRCIKFRHLSPTIIIAVLMGTLTAMPVSADVSPAVVRSHNLAQQGDLAGAYTQIRLENRDNKKNLAAWKMRIWLGVMTGDDTDALKTIEWIGRRMPASDASSNVALKSLDMAEFLGETMGFLSNRQEGFSGPVDYSLAVLRDELNPQQLSAMQKGFDRVAARYATRARQVAQLTEAAVCNAERNRETKLAVLDRERQTVFVEFDKLESLRAEDRERASNERNVHAATRSREASRTAGFHGHRRAFVHGSHQHRFPNYDYHGNHSNQARFNTYHQRGRGHGLLVTTHGNRGAFHNRFAAESGLRDKHYYDVNQREDDYDRYLKLRNNEEKSLMQREPSGVTPTTVRATKEMNTFATYVSMPIQIARVASTSS